MKFKVERTNQRYDDIQPCEGSILEKYNYIEVRTLQSFETFDKKFGKREGTWLSKGTNHFINEEGYILREFVDNKEGWFINIDTLEELIDFQNKYGELVLRKDYFVNKNINVIEIYDESRE